MCLAGTQEPEESGSRRDLSCSGNLTIAVVLDMYTGRIPVLRAPVAVDPPRKSRILIQDMSPSRRVLSESIAVGYPAAQRNDLLHLRVSLTSDGPL